MRHTAGWHRWRRAASIAILGALAGCSDLFESRPRVDVQPTTPGIHPLLVIAEEAGGRATLEIHLRSVQVAEKISSYQGELTYDRSRLRLESASVPSGVTGVWHEVKPGTVRLAGVAVDGMQGEKVLVMRFQATGAVQADAFELRMEELVASQAFRRMDGALRQRARPLLLRN